MLSLQSWGYIAVAVLLLTLLWCFSTHARYYGKMVFFLVTSCFVSSLLPLPFFIIRPRDYRNGLGPAHAVKMIGRIIGMSFEIRGVENINRKNGGVVLVNHQSGVDLIVCAWLWPVIGRATVVVKKEVFYLQPFGLAVWLWGTIFLDRKNKNAAFSSLNQQSDAITNKGSKIIIFPEGTRHQGDNLLPFKKGSFYIAIQSQSIIQPVVVSRYHHVDSKRPFFGRGHSVIKILPEISCKGLTKPDIDELMNNVQNLMNKEYKELSNEMLMLYNSRNEK